LYCIVFILFIDSTIKFDYILLYFTELLVVVWYIIVYYADMVHILHVLWICGTCIKNKIGRAIVQAVSRRLSGSNGDLSKVICYR
jgi:hypothetical protein